MYNKITKALSIMDLNGPEKYCIMYGLLQIFSAYLIFCSTQGRTHSYYPCQFNRNFPCQNVDRTQIAY